MKVAAVQYDIQWEDRAASHARVRETVAKADIKKGTLVVLPEMFDVGFSMNTAATDPGEPSVSEAFLSALAKENGVGVLAGVVARTSDGRFANEAVCFASDGKLLSRYRKMQPFTPPGEHVHYPGGTTRTSLEWDGVKVSPFVCYDLRFPELFRPAARNGAELIVVVANWPDKRSEHWVRLLQARAIENQAYVIGVNRVGTDPFYTYTGRSLIVDYNGDVLADGGGEECAIACDLDLDSLRKYRQGLPFLADLKL